jgi:predicted MFS family arabinose efflux permease
MIKKFQIEWIVVAMAGIQFINIVEFMMIMPLGPDFAKNLNIPLSDLAYLSGTYTATEAIASFVMAFFLDRFDRRAVLATMLIGFTVGTLSCILATDFKTLLLSRAVTGLFGGPLSSLVMAIVIDSVPLERRGKAIGAMTSSFSLAAVFGVPIGLELARIGGWQFPFIVIAIISTLMLSVIFWMSPRCCADLHDHQALTVKSLINSWVKPKAIIVYTLSIVGMGTAFMLIPNISAYIQYNLNYSREDLTWLYLAGGAMSFLASQFAGYAIDRWNTLTVTLASSVVSLFSIYNGFVIYPIELPVMIIFTLYMTGNSMSAVARTSCVSHIPSAEERAGFMLLYGAMRCIGITLGSFFSALVLQTSVTGQLSGMSELAMTAMVLSLVFPLAVWRLERQLMKEGATC